jgi:DNA adenine methylase
MKPPLKWVGSKRRVLPILLEAFKTAEPYEVFVEPFLGSGAVLLGLKPNIAVVGDSNKYLIAMFVTIKERVQQLSENLAQLQQLFFNSSDQKAMFYHQRALFNKSDGTSITVAQVARLIFLNKTCFNGIFRVNRKGDFNTSFGRNKTPEILNDPNLRAISTYLNNAQILFVHGDYKKTIETAITFRKRLLLYMDPPYLHSYTRYGVNQFLLEEHVALKHVLSNLPKTHAVFISNSNTKKVQTLYTLDNWELKLIKCTRTVNCATDKRQSKKSEEVLITRKKT